MGGFKTTGTLLIQTPDWCFCGCICGACLLIALESFPYLYCGFPKALRPPGEDWPFLKQYPYLEGSAHPFHSTDFPECLRLCVFLQQLFIITCDVSGTVQGSRVVTVYQRPLLNIPRMSLPWGLCTHLPGAAGLAAFSLHLPSSLESPVPTSYSNFFNNTISEEAPTG